MDAYRPLAALPQLHQDWSEPQADRSAAPSELYTDLFVVAAISNLSHLFTRVPDGQNAGRIVLYHALIFFLWSESTTLKSRFSLRGLLFRVLGLGLQLGLLGLIIGSRDDTDWARLLAGGYALARLCLACAHATTARHIPRARGLCTLHACASLLLAAAPAWLAWRGAACYASHVRVMCSVAVGEALLPVVPSLVPRLDLPLHVLHMNERLGQLVMLHLGEAVISIAGSPLQLTSAQCVGVALAAVVVWALHLAYFHVEPAEHEHAIRQSRARGLAFSYGHWVLALALLFTGAGLRLLLGIYPKPPHEDVAAPFKTTLLVCTSYAASLHVLALIRAAHFLSVDGRHKAVASVERAGTTRCWVAWWATLWCWPLPIYALPWLVRRVNEDAGASLSWVRLPGGVVNPGGGVGVSVSLLLGLLAAHAVVLTCCESLFAHLVTKTPIAPAAAPEEARAGLPSAVESLP